MKITKDTQKMKDANEFGETIRNYAFIPENEYGCYSTFDLRKEFDKVPPTVEILKFVLGDCMEDKQAVSCYSNGSIIIAWYWDGDGTLYIQEEDKRAINYDCKKAHEWRWVEGDFE